MKRILTIASLQAELDAARKEGRTIGLVPTMGALHEGHASLVRRSVAENDLTVVSIFLNPTQFNDKTDLAKYPRTLEADCALLEACGADIAFPPSVEEIYPEPDTRRFSYPPTDSVMEGAFRPGHFNGVCQIVSKLFAMTQPTRAYFGEKDFQAFEQRRAFCFGNHIVHHLAVTLLECFEFGHVGFIAIGSLFHQSDETVGHSAERRNHHNHRTFRPADNISDMKDALTRANGRSSEFEYFHFDNV